MKELSVFIDESGDFGEYDFRSLFYIITMVFHEQNVDISQAVTKLDQELSYLNLSGLCIHTGPIIRKEEIYSNMSIQERCRIFNKMLAFFRQINIRYKSFYIKKKHVENVVDATGRLSKQIFTFMRDHSEVFLSFDDVKIYYDNGQIEVSKILSSVFNVLLPNPIFRKVMPLTTSFFRSLICSVP